jgi:DNA-binding PadR family transcriptional regulator
VYNKHSFSTQPRPDGPFRRGLFKFIVLQYLQDNPRHGYEIMRSLAHRFHGLYTPSSGTVYPRLQRLVERGFVTFIEENGRKVYSITDEGRHFLAENSELAHEINDRLNDWENPENIEDISRTMRDYNRLGEMLSWEVRKLGPSKLRHVREVIFNTFEAIENIIKE